MIVLPHYDALADEQKAPFLPADIAGDPDAVFSELRAIRPILTIPGNPHLVIVTRAVDVRDVLNQWFVFTVHPYAAKMDPSVGPFMLARDDSEINERDKSIMLAVMPRSDLPRVRYPWNASARARLGPALPQETSRSCARFRAPSPLVSAARYSA